MIPPKSSKLKLCSRPRSDSDDERLIKRIPVKTVMDKSVGKILFPLPPVVPVVYWERPSNSEDIFCKDDLMKFVRWPIKTDTVCYQCCHAFDGVPVPLPDTYDTRRKVYRCKGNFCSWQCAKSYNINQTQNFGKGNRNMYISLLAHQTWVKYRKDTGHKNLKFENMKTYATYSIKPSRPRELLRIFGGTMGIEEYREGFYGIIPPEEALEDKPFLTVSSRLLLPFTSNTNTTSTEVTDPTIGLSTTTKQIDSSTAHRHSNNFCNTLNMAKTDKMVMKRKRDVSSKNTLMSTMGVVIETKKR